MNRFLCGIAVAAAAIMLVACGDARSGEESRGDAGKAMENLPPDIERIRQRGKLIVAMRTDSGLPLCEMDEDGKPFGLEVTIAEEMASALGVELEILSGASSPDATIDLVDKRVADVALGNLTTTTERVLTTPFGNPYIVLNSALIVSDLAIAEQEGYVNPATVMKKLDTPSMRIGVMQGSYHERLARKLFSEATIVPVAGGWEGAMETLLAKNLDALLADSLQCVRTLRTSPKYTVYYSVYILKDQEEEIAPAFHWEDRMLLAWYNVWLKENNGGSYDLSEIMEALPDMFRPQPATPQRNVE